MNKHTNRSEWGTAPDGGKVELGTFTHEGREFSALGAIISPTHLACYPRADGTVTDWEGNTLGTYKVLSSRPAVFFGFQSWQGSRYYYMRAVVNGRTYSIRGFGVGMLARGKAVKSCRENGSEECREQHARCPDCGNRLERNVGRFTSAVTWFCRECRVYHVLFADDAE